MIGVDALSFNTVTKLIGHVGPNSATLDPL